MTILFALLFASKIARPVATLSPAQQTVVTRLRSQTAPHLATTAVVKLRNISNSLLNGPALADYTDVTRRAVLAAFAGQNLTDRGVNTLSTIVLSDAVDSLKKQLDSMSELGEMQSLRLQMAMDRLSKLMSTLSNLLKKEGDTTQSIVDNLK